MLLEKDHSNQGSQPPVCFSSAVADNLVFDEVKSSPNLYDVEVQQNLDNVRLKRHSFLFSLL